MKNTIYIIIVLLLSIDICKAQPINDNCPGTTLSSTTICTTTAGTLAAGTFSGSAASCGGLPNHDVFYNFIATNTAVTEFIKPIHLYNKHAAQHYSIVHL